MVKVAKKTDWDVQDMPRKTAKFMLDNDLSDTELEELKTGHIPQEMEDKWFSYYDEGKLYIHRSWSGFCIFIVEFSNDKLLVTTNRNKKQVRRGDVEEDKRIVQDRKSVV